MSHIFSCSRCHAILTPTPVYRIDEFSTYALNHRCRHWKSRLERFLRLRERWIARIETP